MDPLSVAISSIALVNQILHLQKAFPRILYAWKNSKTRDNAKRISMALETSQQKFQVWKSTWVDNVSDPTVTSEALWGPQGWVDIQKLLLSIVETVHRIEALDQQSTKVSGRSTWKRSLSISSKKDRQIVVKGPTMLDLAMELSRSIDQLWTYSEVAFDSLHGIFAQKIRFPSRDRLLNESLGARAGSVALYRACHASRVDCSVEMNLFSNGTEAQSLLLRRDSASSISSSSLFYHLFTQDRDTAAKLQDMTIESLPSPRIPDSGSKMVDDSDQNDLHIFETSSALKSDLVCLRPKKGDPPSFFRVAKPQASVSLESQTESLAQILYKVQLSGSLRLVKPLSSSDRVELAFKLVECGFYLLGTPWLASLGSTRLRRMETEQGRNPFILDIQTLDLDDLYFEDPGAMAEPSQLFRIGILLMEIALSDPHTENPVNVQDLDLRTSKMLSLVEQSMGPQYCKATAFCLQGRRSTTHFGRPEKYRHPEETGWQSYLTQLLEDYHAQVFLR